MSPFRAGILALVIVGCSPTSASRRRTRSRTRTSSRPCFNDVNNLKPKSPVRIAGVEVGKVKKVEPVDGEGQGAAMVDDGDRGQGRCRSRRTRSSRSGRASSSRATSSWTSSPARRLADELDDGGTIPVTQTAAPGAARATVLTALQSDTREDLQTFLREYSKGPRRGRGARASTGDQVLGARLPQLLARERRHARRQDADHDLQRVLEGAAEDLRRARRATSVRSKDLVTNFNVTVAAFAREDAAPARRRSRRCATR